MKTSSLIRVEGGYRKWVLYINFPVRFVPISVGHHSSTNWEVCVRALIYSLFKSTIGCDEAPGPEIGSN